jgi:hypothetical protein
MLQKGLLSLTSRRPENYILQYTLAPPGVLPAERWDGRHLDRGGRGTATSGTRRALSKELKLTGRMGWLGLPCYTKQSRKGTQASAVASADEATAEEQ